MHSSKLDVQPFTPIDLKEPAQGSSHGEIQEYEFPRIDKRASRVYADVKKSFGSLALTDGERVSKNKKDLRFRLSDAQKTSLNIEEEEKRIVHELVKQQVDEIRDEERKKAYEIGLEEGRKKGIEEAVARYRDEYGPALKKFEELIQSLDDAKEIIFRENEHFLVQLVYQIGRMLALKEIQTDKDYIIRLVKELIAKIGLQSYINIKISSKDLSTVDVLKESVSKSFGTLKNLNIEPSELVNRGGCLVETQWSRVDASIETQLKGIEAALLHREVEDQDQSLNQEGQPESESSTNQKESKGDVENQ